MSPSTKPYIYQTLKFIPSFLHFFSSYHSSSLPFFLLLLSTLLFSASSLSFPVLSYSFLFSYFCLFFPLLSFLSSHVLSYSFLISYFCLFFPLMSSPIHLFPPKTHQNFNLILFPINLSNHHNHQKLTEQLLEVVTQ